LRTFALTLMDSTQTQQFAAVRECQAADASGSFGLLAGHAPFVAVLRYGLLRFTNGDSVSHYVAFPGGILRFADNHLQVVTSRFFSGDERQVLVDRMTAEIAREDSDVRQARQTLAKIEQTLMRHLGELSSRAGSAA
jgi:F-type H+-transporting ATPase subunit epsilon